MTSSIATTPDSVPFGTLELVDPNALKIDVNVRDVPALTKQFINSIAENGVLVPITAIRGDDNAIVVRTGQRRTLAAREAGLPKVPVYVLPNGFADTDTDTIERLVEQIVENDHRAELTEVQRVRGIQQLLNTGLSATKAAKRLAVPSATVKAAKATSGSKAAMDALAHGEVSLLEAAVIAEFEGDPSAVERLVHNAGRVQFEHVAANLRQERADAAAEEAAEQRFRELGYTVLALQPASFDPLCVPLHSLLTGDGEEADEAVVTVPAQWAVLLFESTVLTDKVSGESVAEDDVDWDTEGDTDATPAEGLRHADTVAETAGYVPEFFCLDYQAAGLTPNRRFMQIGGVNRFPTADTEGEEDTEDTDGAPPSPDQLAERRARAAAEAAAAKEETETRERRKVLALNKLGVAAQNVRRQFVTNLLARKTPPKGAAVFVASALARDAYLLTSSHADNTAAELLGCERTKSQTLEKVTYEPPTDAVIKAVEALTAAGDARAQVLTLGLVLGGLEARIGKDAWRSPARTGYARSVSHADYLTFLVANGYTLAPVEEVMAGTQKSDAVYDQYLADKS